MTEPRRIRGRLPRLRNDPEEPPPARPTRALVYALVLVPVLFNLVLLAPEVLVSAPSLNDNAFQSMLVRVASDAFGTGRNPLDFWVPQLELGFPQALYYQSFPHLVVVLLDRLTLGVVDLFTHVQPRSVRPVRRAAAHGLLVDATDGLLRRRVSRRGRSVAAVLRRVPLRVRVRQLPVAWLRDVHPGVGGAPVVHRPGLRLPGGEQGDRLHPRDGRAVGAPDVAPHLRLHDGHHRHPGRHRGGSAEHDRPATGVGWPSSAWWSSL